MKIDRLARRAVPLLVLLALCLPAAFPAAAGAEVQTIDFDSGTLGTPLDGRGDVSFPLSQGFRPYRTDVGIRAHSGTTVGDVGRCAEEVEARGGDAGACELFQAATTGVLARTARSVTLFAGRFVPAAPLDPPEQATLTAFDASGTRLASTGPVSIGTGFNTALSVSDDAGRIAGFTVRATSGPFGENEFAGDLGIDDLSVNFADGGPPDFSISAPTQVLALVQGQSLQVPVRINRVNGSNGPVLLSVSGLPAGVSASPVVVAGAGTTATITLSADPSAPDTAFVPADATITADPLGNANVGPGPREAPLKVRVARDFELSVKGFSKAELPSSGRIQIEAPDCARFDVPVKVTRDIAFDRDVALRLAYEVQGVEAPLPRGIGAEIVPGSVVPPGGALVAERTLRLSADRNLLPPVVDLVFKAEANPGGSARALPLELVRRTPHASISPGGLGSGYGRTPRLGRPGTRVRLHGTGFCPGTKVEVGNDQATAPATLVDPHTIEFNVPRYATTGPVTIVPPGRASLKYESDDTLTVDSFRNSAGFAFKNFSWGALSLSEMTKAFGADDLFIKVNPCWPFGDCTVRTGFLSPLAAIEWGMLNGILQSPGSAHCYGMALASRRFTEGREPYRMYADSGRGRASSVFELSEPLGPGDQLRSFLDAEHVKQYSGEFISGWVSRKRPVQTQLDFLKREFERGRTVEVSIKGSRTRGHVVLAYDLEQTRDKATIYTYDSAVPFEPPEDRSGSTHRSLVDFSNVTVDKASRSWTMPGLYTGGWYGSLWAIPPDTVPEDPSLPGVGTLAKGIAEFVLGSRDSAVEATDTSAGAEFLPAGDGTASPGADGAWVRDDPDRPLEVSLLGRKSGHYSQTYVAPGFVARTADLSTDEGVRDTIIGSGDSLRIESGEARALRVDLARRAGGSAAAGARLETHASADGTDTAGLSAGSTLTYAHDGAPTTAEFTLTAVRRDGGPAKFVSGAVAVGRGDRLRAEPLDRGLRRVRLTILDARGRKTTRVLRDRSRPAARLRLGAPRVRGHRLAVRIGARVASARAMVGLSMRVMRAGRLVARRAIALKRVAGSRQVHWRLPRSLRDGHYRLLVDARAIGVAGRGSPISDSTSARRAAGIRVGG